MVGPKPNWQKKNKWCWKTKRIPRGEAQTACLIAIEKDAPSTISNLADKTGSRNPSRANISDRCRRSGKGWGKVSGG